MPPNEPTRTEEFAKTATAAKMSGRYHETAGFLKRKFGELTGDIPLQDSGHNQELLGKVHRLVGSIRETRKTVIGEFNLKKNESQAICRKHGGRILDVLSDCVDDLRDTFFK